MLEFVFEVYFEMIGFALYNVSTNMNRPLWQRILAASLITIPVLMVLIFFLILSITLIINQEYLLAAFIFITALIMILTLIRTIRKDYHLFVEEKLKELEK